MKARILSIARLTFPLASALAAMFAVSSANAATYYWDVNGTTASTATPSGTWSSGGVSIWSTDANGLTATSAVTTALADDLVFSAGTTATGAYTITLGTTQNAKSLIFEEGTATISGASGVITLGGTGNITVNGGAAAIIGNNTNTVIDGTVGLTKNGAGTLTFNGTLTNTFTGGINVNGGTLALDYANIAASTNLVTSQALGFGGGNLTLKGKTGANATTQTLGNVTVNSGGGSILIDPNNGSSTTLTLGSITATAAGGSLTVGKAVTANTGTVAITTTTDKDATGIYGGRIVFADGTANTGYDWATNTGGGGPYTLSAYSGYTAMVVGATSDTLNTRVTGAGITLTGAHTHNSLKLEGSSGTLDLAGNLLTLTNGGLLVTGTSATIISGTAGATRLTAGNGSGAYDLIVNQYNSGGLTISAVIGNNVVGGTNATRLTKAGTGNLTLSAANTYSGGTTLNAGTLTVTNVAALGTGTATLNGGTLAIGNFTITNAINSPNGTTATINATTGATPGYIMTSSVITGSGTLNFTYTAAAGTITPLLPNFSSFTGTIGVSTASAFVYPELNIGTGAPNATVNVTGVAPGAGSNTNGSFLFVTGSGTLNIGALTGNGYISNWISGVTTWSVGGLNTSTTFSGIMQNSPFGGTGFALTKVGTGTLTLSGVNTYTLATTVNGGTLLLDKTGTGALAATSALVLGGGTFQVKGASSGATTQTLASLSLTAGTGSRISLDPNGGTSNTLTITSNTITTGTGAGMNFNLSGGTTNATTSTLGNTMVAWNPTLTAAGIIGGTYTVTDTGGTGFATVSAGKVVRLADPGSAGLPVSGGVSTTNYFINQNYSTSNTALAGSLVEALSGPVVANTVTVDTTGLASGANLAMGTNKLTVTIGGGMVFSGANPYTISGTTNGITSSATGAITLQNYITGSSLLTISAPITNTTATAVTFAGTGTTRLSATAASNYSGVTTVTGGILEVTRIATNAAFSSIGTPGSTAADRLLLGNGTTLRFIGDGSGNDTTDRNWTLNGISNGDSATLDASGAGTETVTFSNTSSPAYGTTNQTRTINLAGTNISANTLAANIANNGTGAVSVTKSGSGTWVLTGASTYTGATNVNTGTLIVDGSTAAGSAVSVGASGTLGGTGNIAGTLAVTGILSPGTGLGDKTTLDAGTTTWNGGSVWNFDLGAASGSADKLAITGNFTKGTAGAYQFNFMSSAPAAWGNVYTLVTWTGATTFALSDFAFQNLGGSYNVNDNNFSFSGNSLVFTAVPEPTSALAGLLLTAGLLRRRRK